MKNAPKQPRRLNITKLVLLAVGFVGGLTALAKNGDTLADLWLKYFGERDLAPLEGARNIPSDLINSGDAVSVELVQVSSMSGQHEKTYDLYLENTTDHDLLLAEVRYGRGAMYASATTSTSSGDTSKPIEPNASYTVSAAGEAGATALSPPYALRAKRQGAIRIHLKYPPDKLMRWPIGFDIYAADGQRVASVNKLWPASGNGFVPR